MLAIWTHREELRATIVARVDRTEQTGCWNWPSWNPVTGYGQMGFNGKTYGVHRLAYLVWRSEGYAIPRGWDVSHRCNNRRCCNPDHLDALPHRVNCAWIDACGRRRRSIGERNGRSKLTEEQKQRIQELARGGTRQIDLAQLFGITQGRVSQLVRCGR